MSWQPSGIPASQQEAPAWPGVRSKLFGEPPPGPCVSGWGPPGTSCGAPGVLWSALVGPRVCPWVAVGGFLRFFATPRAPNRRQRPQEGTDCTASTSGIPLRGPRSLGGSSQGLFEASVVAWGVPGGSRFFCLPLGLLGKLARLWAPLVCSGASGAVVRPLVGLFGPHLGSNWWF